MGLTPLVDPNQYKVNDSQTDGYIAMIEANPPKPKNSYHVDCAQITRTTDL